MYLIFILFYLIVLLYPFWRLNKLPIYHPSKIVCILYVLYTVPFIFYSIGNERELVINKFVLFMFGNEIDSLLLQYILLQTVGIFFLYLGIFSNMFSTGQKFNFILFKSRDTFKFNYRSFIFFFILSILFFSYLIFSLGGLIDVIISANLRTTFLSGSTYLVKITTTFLYISVVFLIKSLSYKKINIILLLLFYIIYFLTLSAFGGRSDFIVLLLVSFFSYSIFFKSIKIVTLKNLAIVFGVLIYVVVIPEIRVDIINVDKTIFEIFNENIITIARGNEYVSIQLAILGLFNYENLWLGSSYIDLLYSVIPRSIFIDKPPIEEGIYIFNNIIGNSVTPSYPARKMTLVGWPPGTMGVMFANFHILGVVVGYFILGVIYNFYYLALRNSNFNIPLVFIYLFVVIKFELTNHYIFHLITILILLKATSLLQKINFKI